VILGEALPWSGRWAKGKGRTSTRTSLQGKYCKGIRQGLEFGVVGGGWVGVLGVGVVGLWVDVWGGVWGGGGIVGRCMLSLWGLLLSGGIGGFGGGWGAWCFFCLGLRVGGWGGGLFRVLWGGLVGGDVGVVGGGCGCGMVTGVLRCGVGSRFSGARPSSSGTQGAGGKYGKKKQSTGEPRRENLPFCGGETHSEAVRGPAGGKGREQ